MLEGALQTSEEEKQSTVNPWKLQQRQARQDRPVDAIVAAINTCARPAEFQISQNSSMDGEELTQPHP